MKSKKLRFGKGFAVVLGNKRSQAATMVIPAGGREGCPDNNHRGLDQWLFVVSGRGTALVDGKKIPLQTSSLVFIERGENHEIRNLGSTDLVTLNFYVPPGYSKTGYELPSAKAKPTWHVFYSWPTINTVKSWLKQASSDCFIYTVKVCELITHVKRFVGPP